MLTPSKNDIPWKLLVFISIYLILIHSRGSVGESGDRTHAKIYKPINGALSCFRRMNRTHQIGCSSKLTGNVGVLHLVDSKEDLQWVTSEGPHSPYIVLIYADKFRERDYVIQLRDSGRVSGVILLNRTQPTLTFLSPDKTCPNQGYGLYTKPNESHYCENWNTRGNNLLYEDFDFPIFHVSDEEEAEKLSSCYEKFNKPVNGTAKDWPLCSAQLESHMLAAVNSETCVRRENYWSLQPFRICDPMGGRNIWGSLIPRSQQKPYSNNSVIVIGARFDASSMFDGISPGADSAVTSIVAFLGIIKHLSLIKDELEASNTIENVYFMLFSGEAFDYIGSSRIVYDMKGNRFPFELFDNSSSQPANLRLEHIRYFIEVNQVALKSSQDSYFVHSLHADDFFANIQKQSQGIKFTDAKNHVQGLPPSSAQSFVAQRRDLPAVVITNHNSNYANMFYNSIYDNARNIDYDYGPESGSVVQENVAKLAAAVAGAVVNIINPVASKEIKPNISYMNDLFHCYLEAGNCTIFQEAADNENLPPNPYPMYVGVYRSTSFLSLYTQNLLTIYQGVNVTKGANTSMSFEDCKSYSENNQTVSYVWINGSCFETTVNYSHALSPAFGMDRKISWDEWNSGLYSTWTESVWKKFSVRIFLKPSPQHEILTLVSGSIVFLLSFALIFFVNKKSDVIFQSRYSGYLSIPASDFNN